MTGLSPFAGSRDEQDPGARPTHALPPAQARYLRTAVLPAAVIAAVCAAAAVAALLNHASVHTLREVLAAVTSGIALMLVVAVVAALAAGRQVDAQVRTARMITQRGQAELQQMVDRLMRGEQPAPLVPVPARAADGDPYRQFANELEQSQYHAGQAVLRIAGKALAGGRSDQRVEIFVNLARRMQSLVHREIELLDDLESKVEDPDLLKGLFTVDHLATRMRRQSESLAVLGGSASRRQWTRQVTMHEVLRAAVAEVEQYSRVKVVPPVEGVLRGAAVTDVIHLIAELVENATKFSAPHTTAMLRAQHVAAGVAIEIEDRGLGMLPADQQRMNDLLADPGRMNIDELLRDGRIGLYVVAALARRHGVRVMLQNNIYGGTQAVVVLPRQLLELSDRDRDRGTMPYAEFEEEEASSRRLALVPTGAGPVSEPGLPAAPAGQSALPMRRPPSGAASSPSPWRETAGGGTDYGRQSAEPPAARPPLPKRQVQATQPVATYREEFRDAPAARGTTEPPADQMTGLMADFLKGVSRAEDEDSPARD